MPQKMVLTGSPWALTVAGTMVRVQMSNQAWWLGLPKMLGSGKVNTWRVGQAHSRTWARLTDPPRKFMGSSSSSGSNCTAPSATPKIAMARSQRARRRTTRRAG